MDKPVEKATIGKYLSSVQVMETVLIHYRSTKIKDPIYGDKVLIGVSEVSCEVKEQDDPYEYV